MKKNITVVAEIDFNGSFCGNCDHISITEYCKFDTCECSLFRDNNNDWLDLDDEYIGGKQFIFRCDKCIEATE